MGRGAVILNFAFLQPQRQRTQRAVPPARLPLLACSCFRQVEREARPVTVYSLRQTKPAPPLPLLGLELECGGGFYVRTLIEDLARALGTRAHMTALERTKQVRAVRPRGLAGLAALRKLSGSGYLWALVGERRWGLDKLASSQAVQNSKQFSARIPRGPISPGELVG